MLNEKEELFIEENICNYYHVVGCNAHFFGEPFLFDGYLYYSDGSVVTILSQRLGEVSDEKSLNGIVDYVMEKHDPENVILWGEMAGVEIGEREGYRFDCRKPDLWKREMVLHMDKFSPGKKYQRYLRKAKNMGLRLNFADSKYYKSEHLKLMFETHKGQNVGLRGLSYYSVLPGFEKARLVEVLKDGKIISVDVVIEIGDQYICIAENGCDDSIKNISGLSMALLFEYYYGKTKFLSLGGCSSEGIFNFKKEFTGGTPLYFYENYARYDFFKGNKLGWWLERL